LASNLLTMPDPYWLMVLPLLLLYVIVYIWPSLIVVATSLTDPVPGLENYRQLITNSSIQRTLLTTARVCIVTTAISVSLGYVIAYTMTHVGPRQRTAMLLLILIPFQLSLLVRCFSLLMLLRASGLINQTLQALGLVTHPLVMVDNELGVLIGMVHAMIPYAVLVIASNMQGIDKNFVLAAKGLGAGSFEAFWRVYLPMSTPGVYAALLLVSILTLGYFVIPALLGGGRTMMVAEYVSFQALQVARMGISAMMSVVLFGSVVALLAVAARFVDLRALFGAR